MCARQNVHEILLRIWRPQRGGTRSEPQVPSISLRLVIRPDLNLFGKNMLKKENLNEETVSVD